MLSAQLKSPSLFVSGGRESEASVLCRQSIFQQERGEGPPRRPRSSFSLSLSLHPSRRHDGMGSFEADKCPGRCGLINALPVGRTHGRRRAANPLPSSPTTPLLESRLLVVPSKSQNAFGISFPLPSPPPLVPSGSSVAKFRPQSWPNEVTCTRCAVQSYVRLHYEAKCSHALRCLISYLSGP